MGKRFLSVETNACAIQSVYQPYFFCTPPIGRQNWVSSCRHIERGDLRDVLRCFKKFVCLRAVCFDRILSLHLFFAMSASAFLYSMPVDTLELRPFGGLPPNFSLSPASDVDIEDISLLVFTILDWFCILVYLLLSTSSRERHCVVWHCHHGSRVGAQDMFTSKL